MNDSLKGRMTDVQITGLFDTNLFTLINKDLKARLCNTEYYYDLMDNSWGILDAGHFYECKFEFVLDHVDRDIQTKLLFHLDIFR
jgi:hypothetical protein